MTATIASSSNKVRCNVSMARPIKAERSYTGTTSTPAGRLPCNWSKRFLTAAMVAWALPPWRITMMPPTTSP